MTPIYDALMAEHPEVSYAIARKRWTYADALAQADKAIALAPLAKKRPAKKAAPRKAKG